VSLAYDSSPHAATIGNIHPDLFIVWIRAQTARTVSGLPGLCTPSAELDSEPGLPKSVHHYI
jgi:hypothetical protein